MGYLVSIPYKEENERLHKEIQHLQAEVERLEQRGDDYLAGMERCQDSANAAVDAGLKQQKRAETAERRVEELERERVKEAALVMANARRIVKRTTMSNARLFMELHGSGMGTAIRYCREMLGLDPDDNKTRYNDMTLHIEQLRAGNGGGE